MTHRFPVKEIARQSGLSTATVDRVLNNRAHVSPQASRRVADAIEELARQEGQLAAKGRQLFIDVVVEAPDRFLREIRRATDTVLADFKPAAIRPRFSAAQTMTDDHCVSVLRLIEKRGSQGVCLKVRDTPQTRNAVRDLAARNIPVVTVFTDLPASERLAYAGLDNRSAGKTAAYLMHKLLPRSASRVLTTLSQHSFQGEEERYIGFRAELELLRPNIVLADASGGGGLNAGTAKEVANVIQTNQDIAGIYSMGGGNKAVLEALESLPRFPSAFVAHDLDQDNLDLLKQQRLSFVLHHDLRKDMRAAFRHILAHHGIGTPPANSLSDIQIVTPENIPFDWSP